MNPKELGYVELEWTCSNCGTRNLGARKNCASARAHRWIQPTHDRRHHFDAGGQQSTYQPQTTNEFARFQRGSHWQLKVNGVGSITELKSAP